MPRSRAAAGLIAALGLAAAACLPSTTATTNSTSTTAATGATAGTIPTTTTTRPGPSDEELRALLPDVPVTTISPDAAREIGATKLEQQRFYADCLTRAGFAATVDPEDLSVSSPIPPDQQDRYWAVVDECNDAMVAHFPSLAEPDPVAAYRAYLYVRECMIAEGWPVTDPPTLDTYLEDHGASWHPYDAVMADPTFTYEDFQRLETTCPQDLGYLIPTLGLDR